MSAFPEGTQPSVGNGKDARKRRRISLLAGIAGLTVVSLLVLLAGTGLMNPPNSEQEAEATAEEDLSSNDTAVEIVPVSDDINSEMEDTNNDDVIVPNNGNGFIGGYVSYPGEVKVTRNHHGNNDLVGESNNDELVTVGGSGGGGADDDDQTGGTGFEGTGVCDQQYWQNNPENWPQPLSPDTQFSSVFGIPITWMEDLTLMEALGLNEGLENELLSEGAAGMLNAMHEEIDYPKSVALVIRNVLDGLDPQYIQYDDPERGGDDDDLQKRIDLLRSANNLSCPLLSQ